MTSQWTHTYLPDQLGGAFASFNQGFEDFGDQNTPSFRDVHQSPHEQDSHTHSSHPHGHAHSDTHTHAHSNTHSHHHSLSHQHPHTGHGPLHQDSHKQNHNAPQGLPHSTHSVPTHVTNSLSSRNGNTPDTVHSSAGEPSPKDFDRDHASYLNTRIDDFVLENIPYDRRDFSLPDMAFIAPDDLTTHSNAFPPLTSYHNTPALAPKDKAREFLTLPAQSPILPGQNEKSYNKEHLYHKQKFRRNRTSETPLVSPALVPLDPHSNHSAEFEPLTSPALKAQDRRRSLALTDEYGGVSKRRTPHLTPNLSAQSKLKRTPSRKGLQGLGPASVDNSASDSTPMLPPLGKVPVIQGGPSLMGFTMGRLAEQTSGTGPSKSMSLSTSGSSVHALTPSVYSANSSMPFNLGMPSHPEVPDSGIYSNDGSPSLQDGDSNMQGNLSLSETSPMIKSEDRRPAKKASHKIAEQGRRNRMNQAVQDLASLIPQSYHEKVAVPSKATTVELGLQYIVHLLERIEELKQAR